MSRTRAIFLLISVLGVTTLTGCAVGVVGGAAASAGAAVDRRSAGTLIDDELVELKCMQILSENEPLWKQVHVNVTSYNGVVLLSGEAPEASLKETIGATVAAIPKVRHVHNELAMAAPSTMLARTSDTYLSAKVKTALLSTDGIQANNVKVVSESGVVYLMGMASHAEADAATSVVRQVSGVEKVVRLFEYVD